MSVGMLFGIDHVVEHFLPQLFVVAVAQGNLQIIDRVGSQAGKKVLTQATGEEKFAYLTIIILWIIDVSGGWAKGHFFVDFSIAGSGQRVPLCSYRFICKS